MGSATKTATKPSSTKEDTVLDFVYMESHRLAILTGQMNVGEVSELWCFIVTVVYWTGMAPDVEALREFWDHVLATFDGVYVLRTNMNRPTEEIAKTYSGLWRIQRTFREKKSTIEVEPIFHHHD